MYSIKEAAARSGVSIATLRAWERRYGVVEPSRTASGYRLYDDGAINRLRQMRGLLDTGWRPREAAAEVLAGRAPALLASSPPPPRDIGPAGASAEAELIEDFLSAVTPFNSLGVEAVLDETFARAAFEPAMERVVFPALREVGRQWANGAIDVAAEHAASQAVMRRLSTLFNAAARPAADHDAVLGLPPGARHDLGAMAFGIAARRVGVNILYLGADVPVESWQKALEDSAAGCAVIAVPMERDVPSAVDVVSAVSSKLPHVRVLVGGAGAVELTQRTADGALMLPPEIGAAARILAEHTRSAQAARSRSAR